MLIYLAMLETEKDRRHFADIYEQYRNLMMHVAVTLLKDRHKAEDAVHEAFTRAISHWEKFCDLDGHKTRGLLVIIVRHICIDIIRKRQQERIESFEEASENSLPRVESDDYQRILELMRELNDEQASILHLKYVYGYDYAEIGEILHMSNDAVRKRVQRARNELKSKLAKEGIIYE